MNVEEKLKDLRDSYLSSIEILQDDSTSDDVITISYNSVTLAFYQSFVEAIDNIL